VKKLQVKTTRGWAWVFCRNLDTSSIQTTPEKRQALPSLAVWAPMIWHISADSFPPQSYA
jgi:hypothetical protein